MVQNRRAARHQTVAPAIAHGAFPPRLVCDPDDGWGPNGDRTATLLCWSFTMSLRPNFLSFRLWTCVTDATRHASHYHFIRSLFFYCTYLVGSWPSAFEHNKLMLESGWKWWSVTKGVTYMQAMCDTDLVKFRWSWTYIPQKTYCNSTISTKAVYKINSKHITTCQVSHTD